MHVLGGSRDRGFELLGEVRRKRCEGGGLKRDAEPASRADQPSWWPLLKHVNEDYLRLIEAAMLNALMKVSLDELKVPLAPRSGASRPRLGCKEGDDTLFASEWLLGPHAAALGLKFYTGDGFGAQYRDAIFLARHGSWNRSVKLGGDVVVIKLNRSGTVRSIEPFITGFIQNNNYVGRAVDLLPMKDGSLLVSDDFNGAVYRVSRTGARVAGK
jgi:hypothetical protein